MNADRRQFLKTLCFGLPAVALTASVGRLLHSASNHDTVSRFVSRFTPCPAHRSLTVNISRLTPKQETLTWQERFWRENPYLRLLDGKEPLPEEYFDRPFDLRDPSQYER